MSSGVTLKTDNISVTTNNTNLVLSSQGAGVIFENSRRHYAYYYRSSSQSIGNASFTTVQYNSQVTSTSWSISVSSGVFTIPIAGLYQIVAGVEYQVNAVGDRILVLLHNSTNRARSQSPPSAVNSVGIIVSAIISMAANDTLTLSTYQSSGGSLNIGNYASNQEFNFFNIVRLSA